VTAKSVLSINVGMRAWRPKTVNYAMSVCRMYIVLEILNSRITVRFFSVQSPLDSALICLTRPSSKIPTPSIPSTLLQLHYGTLWNIGLLFDGQCHSARIYAGWWQEYRITRSVDIDRYRMRRRRYSDRAMEPYIICTQKARKHVLRGSVVTRRVARRDSERRFHSRCELP